MNTIFNYTTFDKFPALESERLLFRKFNKKDASQLFKIRSNEQVMKFRDIISMKTLKETVTQIKSFIQEFNNMNGIT